MTTETVTKPAPGRALPLRRLMHRWFAPPGQPPWARPALLAIATLAAVLYAWNLGQAGYPPFYSMAVKSMSMSWKALIYGAADPQASLTIDKLAGSFVPQAISARIFGFHAWSLALPQVIEGTVSVLVIYRAVRRWVAGNADTDTVVTATAQRSTLASVAGLLAAAILGFTPVVAAMSEHSMEDGALIMCLVLAADRYQYAVLCGRLRSLVFSGIWVGLAFQAKMLEAWLVLPALALGYLLTAALPLRRRVLHTLTAGAVTLVASLSWVLLYTLTPGTDRPYIDGSTNNNAFAMVFGYNGLAHFGIHLPGAIPAENTANAATAIKQLGLPPSALQSVQGVGTSGWTKLFSESLGPQIGWLYPLAALSLLAGLWWCRRRPRTDPLRGGFVLWGTWLLVAAVVYSAMTIPHTAYLALLAPPLAALSGAGIVLSWRTRLMPVLIAAEAAWTVYLTRGYTDFLPWLEPTVLALSAIAVIGTALRAVLPMRRLLANRAATDRITVLGVTVLGVTAMLATPIVWAGSTFDTAYNGSALDATAGPDQANALSAGQSQLVAQISRLITAFVQQSATLPPPDRKLLAYVDAHRGPASTYAFATDYWLLAQPYIEGAGAPVLPMGGFSAQVPLPTLAEAKDLVRTGRLSYFLLNPPGSFSTAVLFGSTAGQSLTQIDNWVRTTCAPVPTSAAVVAASMSGVVLYACAPSSTS